MMGRSFKGTPSDLRQFLAIESPLKMILFHLKVGLPKKIICFNDSPSKTMKIFFNSSQKLFSFSRYLNFWLDFLGMQKKRFDQKDKVNFKIYGVTTWSIKMNYNTHIAQYHTNNGIWSVNRKTPGEIFFFKNYVEICANITYKHGIYKLHQVLPNDLRLRILGSQETVETSRNDSLIPSILDKMKVLLILEENS